MAMYMCFVESRIVAYLKPEPCQVNANILYSEVLPDILIEMLGNLEDIAANKRPQGFDRRLANVLREIVAPDIAADRLLAISAWYLPAALQRMAILLVVRR